MSTPFVITFKILFNDFEVSTRLVVNSDQAYVTLLSWPYQGANKHLPYYSYFLTYQVAPRPYLRVPRK
jgi:hypothetical protein